FRVADGRAERADCGVVAAVLDGQGPSEHTVVGEGMSWVFAGCGCAVTEVPDVVQVGAAGVAIVEGSARPGSGGGELKSAALRGRVRPTGRDGWPNRVGKNFAHRVRNLIAWHRHW